MKTIIAFAILAGAVSFSSPAFAQGDISYPGEDPYVTITVPKGWTSEGNGNLLHLGPEDGTMYVGFVPMEEGSTPEQVGEIIGGSLNKLVDDYVQDGEGEMTSHGIELSLTYGSGQNAKTGEPVKTGMIFFSPDDAGEHLVGMLYFGSEEAEEEHGQELKKLLKSIRQPD